MDDLTDAVPDGIVVAAVDTLEILQVNSAACRLFGYPESELLHRHVPDLHPADRWPEVRGHFMALGGVGGGERRLASDVPCVDQAGRIFHVDIVARLVEWGGRGCLVGVFRDITDRKRGEDALRESERRYREIVMNSPMGMHMYELATDGRLVFAGANPAADRILGVDHAPFVGMAIEEAFPPLRQTEVPARYRAAARDGVAWHTEQIDYQDDRIRGAFDVRAFQIGPCRMVALFADITARKEAERAIILSEARYRTIVENLNDAFYIHDFQGTILDCNDNACRMTGYSREELLTGGLRLIDDPDNAAQVSARMRELIGTGHVEFDGAHVRKDGRVIPLSISGRVVSLEGRGIAQSFVRDITERKRMEDALRESVAKLSSIFRVAPTGIGVVQNRMIVELNERICEMTGYSREELLGRSARMLYPTQEDFDHVGTEKYRQIAERGTGTVETRWQRKDGQIIQMLLSSTPIDPGNMATGVTFTALDITDRKNAEEARRNSEEKFLKAFQSSPLLMAITTADGGRFLDVNQFFLDTLGFNREEVIGRTAGDLKIFLEPEKRGEILAVLKEKGSSRNHEVRVRTRRGEIRDGVFSAEVIELQGRKFLLTVMNDVTDRKRAEEALRRSQILFSSMFRMSPAATILSLVEDGKCVDVSEAYLRLTGYSREELVGRTTLELNIWYSAEERKRVVTELAQKGRLNNVEIRIRRKDGDVRDTLAGGEVLTIDGQRYILSFFYDITDRKQLMAELTQKNKELESLIYAASHDLRSPLVNIQGFSQRLDRMCADFKRFHDEAADLAEFRERARPLLDERMPASLGFIRASVARMDALIAGLLQLSRVGRVVLRLEPLDMSGMLESILAAMTFQVQQVGARVELSPLPLCQGDSGQINRVFSNLMDNAIKHRDPGRPLVVRVSGRVEGERVVYTVEDTGKGIPAECMEKIWELFYRLDPQAPESGDGLGLTIARRIVERHNGRIWVESKPGEGSRFFVELPVGSP